MLRQPFCQLWLDIVPSPRLTQLFSFQDKCTHPEDVRLCTMIVKSNGSFPVNKKKVVRGLFLLFCLKQRVFPLLSLIVRNTLILPVKDLAMCHLEFFLYFSDKI